MGHNINVILLCHIITYRGQVSNQIDRRSIGWVTKLRTFWYYIQQFLTLTSPKLLLILHMDNFFKNMMRKNLVLTRNLCEQIWVWEPIQFLTNNLGALVAGGSNDVQSWSCHPCAGYSKELMQFSIFENSEIFTSRICHLWLMTKMCPHRSLLLVSIDVGLRVSIEGLAARPSDPAGRRSYLRQ